MIEVTSAAWAAHITQYRYIVSEIDTVTSGCWDMDSGKPLGMVRYHDGGVLYYINPVEASDALHS